MSVRPSSNSKGESSISELNDVFIGLIIIIGVITEVCLFFRRHRRIKQATETYLHSKLDERVKSRLRQPSALREDVIYTQLRIPFRLCAGSQSSYQQGDTASAGPRIGALSVPCLRTGWFQTLAAYFEGIGLDGGSAVLCHGTLRPRLHAATQPLLWLEFSFLGYPWVLYCDAGGRVVCTRGFGRWLRGEFTIESRVDYEVALWLSTKDAPQSVAEVASGA